MPDTKQSNGVREFLWNLAGFKKNIIATCKVDKFHAAVIGALLLMVGIYACFAWIFFFRTVTDDFLIPIAAGIFMGGFIMAFDRALIASMASGKANVFSLGFRLVLAILLGVFLSQPIILRLYQPEIKRESVILLDQKIAERKAELTQVYQQELTSLETQKLTLEKELSTQRDLVTRSEKDFKKEMDGSGGTKKYGYSTVAKQKEKILQGQMSDYENMAATHQPRIAELQGRINTLNDQIYQEVEAYRKENAVPGTLIQAEALQSLLKKDTSGTLTMRYYLLSFILTLIELSALIAKIFLKTPGYRQQVELIHDMEQERSAAEREIRLAKIEQYKQLALKNELELTEKFFDQTRPVNEEKLETLISDWAASGENVYKTYWARFKRTFMLHG